MASHRVSILFHLDCVPPVYIWSGHGDMETEPDEVFPEGAFWRGAGELISIPTLKQLINGEADRIEVRFSGVTADMVRLAREDRDSVNGAAARIGLIEFDNDWQQIGEIKWHWSGVGGVLITESTASDEGRQRSISLSMASGDTMLSNPKIAYFTAADQAKVSPTDRFCEFVAGISAGTTRRFGPT